MTELLDVTELAPSDARSRMAVGARALLPALRDLAGEIVTDKRTRRLYLKAGASGVAIGKLQRVNPDMR